jgi:hypothetical protein
MGATQKALAHGVPVCAVPFGRDQLEVARRVEVAAAGGPSAAADAFETHLLHRELPQKLPRPDRTKHLQQAPRLWPAATV